MIDEQARHLRSRGAPLLTSGQLVLLALLMIIAFAYGLLYFFPEMCVSEWPGAEAFGPNGYCGLQLGFQILLFPVWAGWVAVRVWREPRSIRPLIVGIGCILLFAALSLGGAFTRFYLLANPDREERITEFACRNGVLVMAYENAESQLRELEIECHGVTPIISTRGEVAPETTLAHYLEVAEAGARARRASQEPYDDAWLAPAIVRLNNDATLLVFRLESDAREWSPAAYTEGRPVTPRDLKSRLNWYPRTMLNRMGVAVAWAMYGFVPQLMALPLVYLIARLLGSLRSSRHRAQ